MTSGKDDRLLQRLLATFKQEARERIAAMDAGLSELTTAGSERRIELVESLFREAHSLKAAAQSVGQKEIGLLCQGVESIFSAVKRGEVGPMHALLAEAQNATDVMDDLLAAVDGRPGVELRARAVELDRALRAALEKAVRAPSPAPAPSPIVPVGAVAVGAAAVVSTTPRSSAPAVEGDRPAAPTGEQPVETARSEPQISTSAAAAETVRLSAQRLDVLLRQAEEMLSEKLAARQLAASVDEAIETNSQWKQEWSKARGALLRLQGRAGAADKSDIWQDCLPLMKFLEWNESHMGALETTLSDVASTADGEARRLALKVDRLLWDMKEILTVPCASLSQLFHRAIRDLAREQGKDVDFAFRGGDLEIDRRILQELKDPLLHLLRNCVDHGIERPQEREAAGKPVRASITLDVSIRDGDRAEFVIADDGGGIAMQRLAGAARKLGLLSANAADPDEAELLRLVFHSGVSTSPMITDVSGRGLGLAIVRERAERLGGRVSVESRAGRGTAFRLVVPLSLATLHGITVRAADRLLAFPSLGVDRVVRVQRATVSTVESHAALDIAGTAVPLVRLSDVLELPAKAPESGRDGYLEAVILGATGRQVAFEVDSVDEDQEILMKPLGKCLVRVRNVQGATILASGEIVPILNVHDLLLSAVKVAALRRAETRVSPSSPEQRRHIMVVEDSITARGLLRSILESAGYRVKTAVDGLEAWTALNLEPVDLVVSDVEMPRMNGFDLTRRIRADKKLAELPVVLVTALDSREDRERGVDVGANAYILKGGFDQGVLLEAVKRLI